MKYGPGSETYSMAVPKPLHAEQLEVLATAEHSETIVVATIRLGACCAVIWQPHMRRLAAQSATACIIWCMLCNQLLQCFNSLLHKTNDMHACIMTEEGMHQHAKRPTSTNLMRATTRVLQITHNLV
eukprot:GHRQ01018250.1.p1 GENE.GHRQ01018250.1~~GHRQ01018250.1.p1  ORF type:complete len:127 (-),score=5.11 GHRQ01018250.1:438-818(-)